ncbi:hypothetical protein ACSBR1_017367 [Camellia fascicularis]
MAFLSSSMSQFECDETIDVLSEFGTRVSPNSTSTLSSWNPNRSNPHRDSHRLFPNPSSTVYCTSARLSLGLFRVGYLHSHWQCFRWCMTTPAFTDLSAMTMGRKGNAL